jgi:hypothetical protein
LVFPMSRNATKHYWALRRGCSNLPERVSGLGQHRLAGRFHRLLGPRYKAPEYRRGRITREYHNDGLLLEPFPRQYLDSLTQYFWKEIL